MRHDQTITPVVVANAVVWLTFAAASPVLTLLVVADVPVRDWSDRFARLNRFQGIGWTMGLLVGVVVLVAGASFLDGVTAQRTLILICSVALGLGFAVSLRTLPPDPSPGDVPSPGRLRRKLRGAARLNVRTAAFPFTPGRFDVRGLHPRRFTERFTSALALYFAAAFLFFTGFGTFFAPLPAYLESVGYGSNGIFVLYLVLNLGAVAFYGRAAGLAADHDAARVQAGGLLARGVELSVLVPVEAVLGGTLLGTAAVAVAFVGLGVTWAVIAVTVATLVTVLSPPTIRGEALGVYGAVVALAGGVGGLLGGFLGATSYAVAFAVAGGLVVAAAAIVGVVGRGESSTTSGNVASTKADGAPHTVEGSDPGGSAEAADQGGEDP